MTVTYTAEVATCRGFGTFLKLLFRWRGSIYKLVWLDLTAFLFLYYVLNILYRTALNEYQKKVFEGIVQYCAVYSNLIPLSFVLGFYVSIVMTRWWNQYTSIPWPDPIAVFVSSNVHGQDERGRVMRRTVMRYVCLCLTMVFINISPRVKKRFPTLENLVEAGLLVENERDIMEKLNVKFPRHSKHWLPIVWAASIVTRARKEGRIRDDFAVKTIIDELNKFRGQCGLLISYDTISVPLVYTQVVTLACYSYFLTAVMAQQWVENKEITEGVLNRIDMYFPIFSTLQFFFYMGWLKVAESLINPFGDDDDDFEVNWMVDRNLQVSYMIVDEMHDDHPELLRDQYWDEIFPNELPYTVASERFREKHPEPSTANIEVSKHAAMTSNMSSVRVDDMVGSSKDKITANNIQAVNYKFPENEEEVDDSASGIHFIADNGKVRHMSQGSSPSLASLSGTMTRVNTVASALKRFLSRDDGRQQGSSTPTPTYEYPPQVRLPNSASSTSIVPLHTTIISGGGVVSKTLIPPPNSIGGSMRITDQVIEEVDEQLTITSMRGDNNPKPHVQDIFRNNNIVNNGSPTTSSIPVDIPYGKTPPYARTQSATGDIALQPFNIFPTGGVDGLLLSSSAPAAGDGELQMPETIQTPIGESDGSLFRAGETDGESRTGLDEDDSTDDFEKLRITREKERIERQKQKIARSISTQPVVNVETGESITVEPGCETNRNSLTETTINPTGNTQAL